MQSYTDEHGRPVREYRPAESVFATTSLDTLGSIPVTVGHPPSGVTATNHRQLSVGHVSDAPPGRHHDGAVEWLDTAVVVSDADTLRKVESGELTEVSMGYLADVVAESGVTPDGQHYDAVQRNIRFNHLALLRDGHARAGSGARLRLDGNQEPTPMVIRADDTTSSAGGSSAAHTPRLIKVDGVDMPYGSDTHVQMLERSITAQTKRADEGALALTAAQTELGAAKATIAAYKPIDVNALVQDELAFRSSVLPALPKAYDFAGKSRETVRADAVGPAVIAEVAKLPEGERLGYVTHALKLKLDAAGKPPATLHVPSVIVDSNGLPVPPKVRVDKRADAFNASFGASPGAAK